MTDERAFDSEQRVQFALATARIGIWEWDLSTDGIRWVSSTAHAFGLTRETAPTTGRAFIELVHPDDRPALGEHTDRAIRERTDLSTEFRIIAPGGAIRWIETHGHLSYDADGRACRLVGVNFDITDRKAFEEQLRVTRGQAERLRTLKATMRTVQDIVSNALMSLQMFRHEAEQLHVSPEALKSFDRIVAETAGKLKALGDLEQVVETEMEMGLGIRYQSPPSEP
jgi:PAS domain S-box-containing protein